MAGPRKKILVLVGSPRKKETWSLAERFCAQLGTIVDVECEMVFLKDLDIKQCRGCFVCLTKGDEFCPHHDGLLALVEKMKQANGVVFATPNYVLQVTAIMKNALDRMAFTFHRPCFFGVNGIAIVTQGAIGCGKILDYFKDLMTFNGFTHVKGLGVTTVTPRTAAEQATIDRKLTQAVRRFAKALTRERLPRPGLVQFLAFRMVRSMHKTTPDFALKDVRYYRDNGWFTSPYFYPVRLGLIKSILGKLIDTYGRSFALKRAKELAA